MKAGTSTGYELRLERELNAPIDRVWAALTDGGQIARWYGPGKDFRIEVQEWDCRVGGSYRVAMHHSDDGGTHTCYGVFRTVEPNRRLAYTWAWEGAPPMDTLVTFELEDKAGQTLLGFTHTGFAAPEARDAHRNGWTGSFDRLAKAVA